MSAPADGPQPRPAWLTDLDLDTLRLVAADLTNSEIAAQLGISEDAVKGRVVKLLKCAKARTRVGLVATALREGWLEPPRPVVLPSELHDQLLVMARMVVADRPLGVLRAVAEEAVRLADGKARRESGAAGHAAYMRQWRAEQSAARRGAA